MLEVTTKQGLRFDFSVTLIEKEAIIYYLTISRSDLEFKYSEAAKFAALFADRAGLPHPVNLSEGDKSIFYAQWLIKPSTWKSMHKMITKVRAANRAEKDPSKAFAIAIDREMEARAEAIRKR
jgi:predicted transcriptional regulator